MKAGSTRWRSADLPERRPGRRGWSLTSAMAVPVADSQDSKETRDDYIGDPQGKKRACAQVLPKRRPGSYQARNLLVCTVANVWAPKILALQQGRLLGNGLYS